MPLQSSPRALRGLLTDGLTLKLAKPLELLHAHNHYTPIVHSRTTLPIEGEQIRNIFSMYCVDQQPQFRQV